MAPRRSTRCHTSPVSYTTGEMDDEMEDLVYTERTTTSAGNLISVDPASSQCATRNKTPYIANPSASKRSHQDDDSDLDYGSKKKPKKRRRSNNLPLLEQRHRPTDSTLRGICASLGIDFAIFDGWAEDPKLRDPDKMRIPFLPNEIMYQIFENCRSEVLAQCQKSCDRFRAMLKDNTKIWRQARQKYYMNFGDDLPFGLDEESLFELATSKSCDYCTTELKAKAYYVWSVRACNECIKTLTMPISEFRKMFKKKCSGQEDWTPAAREHVCNAIYWHSNSNYSKTCWKEHAYDLIEEAEKQMLAGTFDEWIPKQAVPHSVRWKARDLEAWGTSVMKKMESDRSLDDDKSRILRKSDFQNWCKRLPKPIPERTLSHLETYSSMSKTSNYLTKQEFISMLPKLLKERDAYEELERRKKQLSALWRIQQNSLFDRTCTDIIGRIISEGGLSVQSWGTMVKEALEKVGKAQIKIKMPRGIPLSIYRKPWEWQPRLDGDRLLELADCLEERILDSLSRGLIDSRTCDFFRNGDDKIFMCPAHSLVTDFPSGRPSCHHEALMNFRELATHVFSDHGADSFYGRSVWSDPQKVIRYPPSTRSRLRETRPNGQLNLLNWFNPLPRTENARAPRPYGYVGDISIIPSRKRLETVKNKITKVRSQTLIKTRPQSITAFFIVNARRQW